MSVTRKEWHQFRDSLENADFVVAATLLEEDSSLINERNGIGESVLHFFAVENNRPAVEWLHKHGADLNAANGFGTPLIFEVALLGYRDLLLWLIEHGADHEKKDAHGQGLEDYLAEFDRPEMIEFIHRGLK